MAENLREEALFENITEKNSTIKKKPKKKNKKGDKESA